MVYFFAVKFLRSKILFYLVVFLVIMKITSVLIFVNFPQNIFFADITKTILNNLVNQGRQEAGLSPLSESKKLNLAAELKAKDMVKNNYFSHQSPEGLTPWYWFKVSGYKYKYAGENLAIGFFDSEDVYRAWLNSPSHRENILNPKYKEIGMAVLPGFGPNNAIVVVQLFGSEANKKVVQTGEVKEQEKNTEEKGEKLVKIEEKKEEIEEIKDAGIIAGEATKTELPYFYYNYQKYLQYVIYGFLGLILFVLFFAVISSPRDYNNYLLFRPLVIMLLLLAATLLDKGVIYLIFPRYINI